LLVGKNPSNWDLMRRSESWQHLNLKKLAAQWAYANGFQCIGLEVRAPRSRFRVDVAVYRPEHRGTPACEPVVAIFECKQSRPDLLRDIAEIESMRSKLHELQQRRANLERLLLTHYPSHRAGASLFPEWDMFAGEFLVHDGYQRLLRSIIRIQSRLQNCTKFAWITRYRLANLHYMVAPEKMVTLDEIPPGWGLLELTDVPRLNLRQPAQFMRIEDSASWLKRIAQSASLRWLRQEGLIERSQPFQPS
jgi:hypothetical protein